VTDSTGGLPAAAVVVVTGAGGPTGQAVVRRLVSAGADVVGVDAHKDRLDEVAASLGSDAGRFSGDVVDLVDEAATREWAAGLGRVDGVVHLVGGYRGGSVFADNTTQDWAFLHDLLIRTVQNVTLAMHDALVASPQSRFVLVSATAAANPTAGAAGYAAGKSAAEAWTLAMADSFRGLQSGRADDPLPQTAAATVLVVKALVNDGMRAAKPEATFAGYTDVRDLAEVIVGLWDVDAADVNGLRKLLAP
jgi:NADP-dependent 3-hydroxy acid dehydrogenase YdfG